MPAMLETDAQGDTSDPQLPFPKITKSHILNCSVHSWWPVQKHIAPRASIIPLTRPFLNYLRADGIILPDDDETNEVEWSSDHDSGIYSASDNPDAQGDEEEEQDVAAEWRQLHQTIRLTIDELGGRVVPKLNWSAPKDATWMNANTMECRTANDVYLLLKSSDFVTHDLEHAFDDCVDSPGSTITNDDIPYHLVLRKSVTSWNPSVEFRCFVRGRKLLCICQRDLNHFDFLFKMEHKVRSMINEFFELRIQNTFPDENFTFDVYIPQPFNRVWLVDFNPWAPRTDPLLFSWLEILSMPEPPDTSLPYGDFVRLSLNHKPPEELMTNPIPDAEAEEDDLSDDESDADEELWLPELRLIRKEDPEAYNFNTQQYSAHKLPRDVVDASQSGEGLREFARDWQKILEQRQREDAAVESSEDD